MLGRRISHFYVIRALGSGGMGVVYEAQDTRLPRSVAIKFLNPALGRDVDAIRRFKREARLASSLNHPNICTILDVDEGGGQPFIAMELLQGRNLKARLADGPLPLDEILDVAAQLADGLGAAHDQGIMHRDITPGNIFLTRSGVVKLLDFGLARQFRIRPDADLSDDGTTSSVAAGTIHYMAPELLGRAESFDYRCDLFSLGAVLYQMSSGARPFEAATRHEVAAMIQDQPHVPVRQLAPALPIELERVIDKLLAKHPEDRYQTAWALRADVSSMQRHAVPAVHPGAPKAHARTAIAVLPFEIVGSRAEPLESFRDGLAADIAFHVSGLRDVGVAPQTSTRALAGESVRTIGQRLSVDFAIEGSVQAVDDRIRVIATLVSAAHEQNLGRAVKVERQCGDRLTVQDEVAREIVAGLAPAMLRAPGQRYTDDPEAYHAFKRGQHHWRSCFGGGWRLAVEQFQQATERDPQFALAHVALANAYNFLGFYCLLKPKVAFDIARQAAEHALQADRVLAAAHVELALARFGGDWDWERCETEFREALAIEPASPLAHVYYSWLLTLLGRTDAAFGEAEAARQLAPSSRLVSGARAQTFYLAGRYDDAIGACSECLRFDPAYVFAMQVRGLCYMVQGRFAAALADLERSVSSTDRAPFYLGLLGLCCGAAGLCDRALDLIAELDECATRAYVPPQSYVYIYAGIGDRARALEYQERAYEDGASPFNYLTPPARQLYALDPHHKTRLEQMRLTV